MNHSLSNREMGKFPWVMFKLKRWHALSFCLKARWRWGMRRRRADVRRSAGHSAWRFREVLLHIHRNAASVKLIFSSEAALCSEKSSCRLCGGWWTVSLWTTGSPLYSVPASRSATRIFCSLVSARGKQHCLSLLPSSPEPAEHSGRFWVCFGVPWGYTSLKIQINLLCLLFKNFLHFIR